jgi:adenine-specific DNA-methyltransferase
MSVTPKTTLPENLETLSQAELVKLVRELSKRRKFGLVWEDKPEQVADMCEQKLPILVEDTTRHIPRMMSGEGRGMREEGRVKSNKKQTSPANTNNSPHTTNHSLLPDDGSNLPTHLIIEGDNYHALSVLNYTHAGKIDVIYIDPPYNTGAKDWKYNNDYVEKDDAFRHSKFISFLHKRLVLAKNLLSDKGIIIVAIDDYETHSVRFLLDDIFGEENRLSTCVVIHNPGGRQDDRFFATAHEYMLVYALRKQAAKIGYLEMTEEKARQYNQQDEFGKYKLRSLLRTGANSRPVDRPNLNYPIYVNPDNLDITIEKIRGWTEVLPKDSSGADRVWRWSPASLMEQKAKYIVCKKTQNGYALFVKEREEDNKGYKPKTLWNKSNYSSATAISLLKTIFESTHRSVFDYPKSVDLIRDILKITVQRNSTILDFFAGSGTTGHAVLELNAEDGGNRQFILCTNNENGGSKDPEKGIARSVTFPRIKKVIEGYGDKEPIPAEVRYFRTDFVEKSQPPYVTDDDRILFSEKACAMIAVKENCFREIDSNGSWKIFENHEKIVAIYFRENKSQMQNLIKKIGDRKCVLYIFTWGGDNYAYEYGSDTIDVRDIPEPILGVYQRIYSAKRWK